MTEQEWRKEFAFRLRKRMRAKKLNQKQLADLSGIEEHTISRYINATRKPTGDVIARLAIVLECSADYLIIFDSESMEHKKYL